MAKIYCSNCTRLIPKSSNYCRYCGAAQHGPGAATYRVVKAVAAPAASAEPTAGPFIKRRHLDPQVTALFFINYVLRTSILLPLLIIGVVLEPLLFTILLVGYVLILYLIAAAVYSSFYFSIDEHGFQKEHGIIHKRQVSIPYEQIQNVNINRSLIERLLGLARLSIETAGSSSVQPRDTPGGSRSLAEGHLPGLTLTEAKQIHDLLLGQAAASQ